MVSSAPKIPHHDDPAPKRPRKGQKGRIRGRRKTGWNGRITEALAEGRMRAQSAVAQLMGEHGLKLGVA